MKRSDVKRLGFHPLCRPDRGRAAHAASLLLAGVFAAAVGVTGSAAATEPQAVTWPTYFRTGPGRHYTVMQELSRGDSVAVLGCSDRWCRVRIGRVEGYVDEANLAAHPPPAGYAAPADTRPCFDSVRAGYGRGQTFRYCPR